MQVFNLEFSDQEIQQAAAAGRLLSLEIEFSRRCNFRCRYCYLPDQGEAASPLTREEIRDVLLQAKALGAGKIIILGGEPTIYPHLPAMLEFLAGHGLAIEIFTNGTGVDPALASLFAELQVRVVLKRNSRSAAVQDQLAGVPGAHRIIDQALARLRQAGYPAADRFLALSTVICRPNLDELPELWRWLRREGIEPYFEILTPQARAQDNQWLWVDGQALHRLFTELARIDQEEFGRIWTPQPPLVGNRCMRHQVSCVVTANGDVLPCVGITLPQGNIRQQPLQEILAHSPVLRDLKQYRQRIKGACRTCDMAQQCYGCRGAAFQLTGDYLAADPTCWRNPMSFPLPEQ